MSGVKPLGPAYPSNPLRAVNDEERKRRKRENERKKARNKRRDGGHDSKIDEYA